MLLYLVTYDIPCDRRRKKIADVLEGYGRRVQHSVFECRLPHSKFKEMRKVLLRLVNVEEDGFRIYPLSGHMLSSIEVWCGPPIVEFPGALIV